MVLKCWMCTLKPFILISDYYQVECFQSKTKVPWSLLIYLTYPNKQALLTYIIENDWSTLTWNNTYIYLHIDYYNTSFCHHICVFAMKHVSLVISSIMNIGLWDVSLLYLLFNTVKHLFLWILLTLLYLCHVLAQSNSSVKLYEFHTRWQHLSGPYLIMGNPNFRFGSSLQFF